MNAISKMPIIVIPVILALLSGCSMTMEKTSFVMPDGDNHEVVTLTDHNLFVPSTHMVQMYNCFERPCIKVDNFPMLSQEGVGNDVVKELMRGATVVGSTVYAADASVRAAGRIADGLANSGDVIDNSSGSASFSKSKADQFQGQGQDQKAVLKSRSKSEINVFSEMPGD